MFLKKYFAENKNNIEKKLLFYKNFVYILNKN